MGTGPGMRTGLGMGTGTRSLAAQGWGRGQGTWDELTSFPGIGAGDGDRDQFGDGAGDRPARLASPASVISERWLSPISAVVIEAKATDMNSVLPCP